MNNAGRPSLFGIVLRDCRAAEGIECAVLADRLIAATFPAHLYSGFRLGTAENRDWLINTLEALEIAPLDTPWPFDPDATQFIGAVAPCLSAVIEGERRLLMAMAIDELRRFDPP